MREPVTDRRVGATLVELIVAMAAGSVLLVAFWAWGHRVTQAVRGACHGLDVRSPLSQSWMRLSQVLRASHSEGVQVAENAGVRVLSLDTILEASGGESLWNNQLQVFRWDIKNRHLDYVVYPPVTLQSAGIVLSPESPALPTPDQLLTLVTAPGEGAKRFPLADCRFVWDKEKSLTVTLTSLRLSAQMPGIVLTRVHTFRR